MRKTSLAAASFILVIFFAAVNNTFAGEKHHHEKMSPSIGLEEKLGAKVPLDLVFQDENNHTVVLRDLIRKPTIVSLVYYSCPDVCPLLLSGVADVLDKVALEPGKDFSVLTISFDKNDTPEDSKKKKKNYMTAMQRPFPQESWKFLTGDIQNIRHFTDAVGFHFKREKNGFIHPVVLIVLSSDGKIARYLQGVTFLPFDLKMALIEASEGRTGSTINRALQFCFSYDPKGRTYVFNIMRILGISVFVFLIAFIIFLRATGKKKPL
jgi:protein SCO1/2